MNLDAEALRILEGAPIAHLATTLDDGAPHVVPVFIGIEGEHIAIFTGPVSRKARNLRRDPRIAVSIAPSDDPFQPLTLRGRVVSWIDGDEAWRIIDRIAEKYIGGPYSRKLDRVVALIRPEHWTIGIG